MTPNLTTPALLPHGLRDLLPPDAAFEASAVERLIGVIARWGYERVKPPLLEFEDSLLAGSGAALAEQTFRLLDPESHRMMGLRADLTPQVARIAASRLINRQRPLRLAYSGQVLRVRGSQLRPDRQFTQVGWELIGAGEPAADVEVMLLAIEALREIGVTSATLDISSPALAPAILAARDFPPDAEAAIRDALMRRDDGALTAIGEGTAPFRALLAASGPVETALGKIAELDLPAAADPARAELVDVVAAVREAIPDLTVTLDPVEYRGYEYHTGVAFTVFAKGFSRELGRGGRYRTAGQPSEAAVGGTLYLDSVLDVMNARTATPRVLIAAGTPRGQVRRLQADGFATVQVLRPMPEGDLEAAARAQRCGHLYTDGRLVTVQKIREGEAGT